MALFFVFTSCICVTISCGWKSGLDNISSKPTPQQLLGVYKPDKYTKDLLGEGYTEGAEITLEKDGVLKFTNTPKSIFDFDSYYSAKHVSVSGSGRWNVYLDEHPQISLSLQADDNAFKPFSTSYPLYQKGDKYVLFMVVGDPDERAVARFVQQ